MKRSTERFLTTHTGSLPRPDDLVRMMYAKEEGVPVDAAALAARTRSAVAEVVARYRAYAARLPEDTRHLVLHEGHLVYARADEREFICPELAQVAALVGEPDKLIAHIRALEAAGLSHFAFQVTDDPERQMRDFATLVMQRY